MGGPQFDTKLMGRQQHQLQPSVEQDIHQDLNAFEDRLVEIMTGLRRNAQRWQWFMGITILWTLCTASFWLQDPSTLERPLWDSLGRHPGFTAGCLILLGSLVAFRAHRRVIQPYIVAEQTRQVLAHFNMSCDDRGRLILKPKPSSSGVDETKL